MGIETHGFLRRELEPLSITGKTREYWIQTIDGCWRSRLQVWLRAR